MLQPYLLMIVFLSPINSINIIQTEFPTLQSCEQARRKEIVELKKGKFIITSNKCIELRK